MCVSWGGGGGAAMTAQDGGLFTSCPGGQEAALGDRRLSWGTGGCPGHMGPSAGPINLHCGLGAKGSSSAGPM